MITCVFSFGIMKRNAVTRIYPSVPGFLGLLGINSLHGYQFLACNFLSFNTWIYLMITWLVPRVSVQRQFLPNGPLFIRRGLANRRSQERKSVGAMDLSFSITSHRIIFLSSSLFFLGFSFVFIFGSEIY